MTQTAPGSSSEDATSLIADDPWYRLQRAAGLISGAGLNVGRRAMLLAALTWLPVAVWAAMKGRALPGAVAEPLFEHFGIHVKLLIALPALVIGEAVAHGVSRKLIPYFRTSGIVADRDAPRFDAILANLVRWRSHLGPWLVMGAIVAVLSALTARAPDLHELTWAEAAPSDQRSIGFGGWWLVWVSRPIFQFLLVSWMWRIVLAFMVLRRVSQLDLDLVPTHPDRAGGLGFLEGFPAAFACLAFAISCIVASHSAHEVVFHQVTLQSLAPMAGLLLAGLMAIGLAPLAAFLPALSRTKKLARLEYAALVATHGRLVRHRWILGESIAGDEVLDAPELGPVVDVSAMYDQVTRMRVIPVGARAIALVAVPIIVPMLAVVALQVPFRDVVLKILKILA